MELFYERVKGICQKRHINLDHETEYYVVFLLASVKSLRGDRVVMQDLGDMFREARKGTTVSHAIKLQTIGDSGLMIAGFWADFTQGRHLLGVDHYISVGENAYSVLDGSQMLQGPFDSLAREFRRIVGLLNEVSENFSLTSMQNVLNLYERWQHTHDPRLAQVLKEQGIDVVASANPRSIH